MHFSKSVFSYNIPVSFHRSIKINLMTFSSVNILFYFKKRYCNLKMSYAGVGIHLHIYHMKKVEKYNYLQKIIEFGNGWILPA